MKTKTDGIVRFSRLLQEGYSSLDASEGDDTHLMEAVIQMTVAGGRYRRWTVWAGGMIGAAAVAASVLLLLDLSADRFCFTVGVGDSLGEIGQWVKTGGDESRTVRFSDGSHFEVLEQTEARIVTADRNRVTVDLNKGSLRLNVTPRKNNRFAVRAGPYEVQVVGTRFGVDWNVRTGELLVAVKRGRVAVKGPGIDGAGIYVNGGSLLRANGETGLVSYGPASTLALFESSGNSALASKKPVHEAAMDSTSPESKASSVRARRSHRSVSEPEWKRHVRQKDYKAAIVSARSEGLDRLKTSLSSADLWSLASAARYAGAVDDAQTLFIAHRNRFPHSAKSNTALYLLAMLSLDNARDRVAGKQWLETYLKEAPDGALHEEALGRLMNLNQQMGFEKKAKILASNYLKRYPNGHFSNQAENILSR